MDITNIRSLNSDTLSVAADTVCNDTKIVETQINIETAASSLQKVKTEIMERESNDEPNPERVKKCCSNMNKDVRMIFHCCIKTWSCYLNTCEGCLGCCSKCCLCSSELATGCQKCLERIDCD